MRGGEIWCDPAYHFVRYGDKSCRLTRHEFTVCLLLSARPGHIRSRNEILDAMYPNNLEVTDRAVDSQVKRARRKMRDAFGFDAIRVHYGVGYYWENPKIEKPQKDG
jgi:two-component system response regulator ChvI